MSKLLLCLKPFSTLSTTEYSYALSGSGNLVHKLLSTYTTLLLQLEALRDIFQAAKLLWRIRLQVPVLQPLGNHLKVLLPELLVAAPIALQIIESAVLKRLPEDGVRQRALDLDVRRRLNLVGLAGQNAHDVPALGRDRLHNGLGGVDLADAVKCILQLVARRLLDLLDPVRVAVVDRHIRAEALQQLVVPLAAGGDDLQARLLGKLDRIEPDAARAAVDQDRERLRGRAGRRRQCQALEECLHDGGDGQRDDGGLGVGGAVGYREDQAALGDEVLGEGTARGVRAAAEDPAGDALALVELRAVGVDDAAGEVAADGAAGVFG